MSSYPNPKMDEPTTILTIGRDGDITREWIFKDTDGNQIFHVTCFFNGYVNIDVRARDAKARVFHLSQGKDQLVATGQRDLDTALPEGFVRQIISVDCNHKKNQGPDNGLNLK